jgi:NTE family protein
MTMPSYSPAPGGVGLVLGAGGTVGLAYHCGALYALEQVAGVKAADADLIVGTSAGSVVGAYLRAGWTTDDMWQFALGTHPTLAGIADDELDERRRAIFVRAWANPRELARRGVGSAYVLARSVVRAPLMPVPAALRRRFPGGLFAMAEGERRFADELPESWPERPLWLCAVDISSGRRVVLGRPGAPPASLRRAVMASCAIPGVYKPVRVGAMTLVDGGAHSTTNLDLASRAGCRLVIAVAPMAFDTAAPPDRLRQITRRVPARALANETRAVRRRGADVLLVRPTGAEVALHGANLMRRDAGEAIARSAYEVTARIIATERFRTVLEAQGL